MVNETEMRTACGVMNRRHRSGSYRCGRRPAFRACRYRETRSCPDLHLRHGFGVPCDHVPRADIAVERHQFGEETARPQHRIAAPCRPATGTAISEPRSGANASIRRSISFASISGMSPRHITAPSAFSGTALMPAFTDVARPSAKSGLRTNLTSSPFSAASTSPPDGR